jgi:hypothetical protein
MPIDPSIVITCSAIITSLICVMFAYSIYKYIKRLFYIKNFKDYISVLEYHMDKAYDIIHKDRILAFSLDAYRVPDEEYETISQDYVRVVQKYIGPTLLKEFVQLYGNEDAFLFIVLDFFNRKYEDDEIRKSAMDNITQQED